MMKALAYRGRFKLTLRLMYLYSRSYTLKVFLYRYFKS